MLIFRIFAQVWPSTGTPALATFVSGLAAAIAALFIRLEILVEMMSIGKLHFMLFSNIFLKPLALEITDGTTFSITQLGLMS